MKNNNRPGFPVKAPIATLLLILAVGFSPGAALADSEWAPLRIVDIPSMAWDTQPRFNAKSKSIPLGSQGGNFVYSAFSPSWGTKASPPGLPSHYHLWHEWVFVLKGDFVINEPVTPYQKNGAHYRYIEGTWLDRPAYTLHGGSWETGGLRAQNPCTLIIFEEGDGSVINVSSNGRHFKPDFPNSKPDPYDPDWQAVKQFNRPWIVDSATDLEWESDPNVAGRLIKWLSDNKTEGFRAQLIKIPPGWSAPDSSSRSYFREANQVIYMVYGDMKLWNFDNPEDPGEATTVSMEFFIHRPARSLLGYGPGAVSENGAVWLEVTYAKGLAAGGGPIEEAVTIN